MLGEENQTYEIMKSLAGFVGEHKQDMHTRFIENNIVDL